MDKLSMDKLSMDKEIKLHEAGCRSYLTALPVRPGFIRMSMLLPADVSVLSGWLRMYIEWIFFDTVVVSLAVKKTVAIMISTCTREPFGFILRSSLREHYSRGICHYGFHDIRPAAPQYKSSFLTYRKKRLCRAPALSFYIRHHSVSYQPGSVGSGQSRRRRRRRSHRFFSPR